MKLDPLLKRAAGLAKKKNYEAAMKILKDEEDRYYGAFKYYYLCGVISLYSGSYLDAKQYFERARKEKINNTQNMLGMNDTQIMLGMAALYIRGMGTRGTNISQAIDYYLDVLEIDPKNKIANRALAVIKANSTPEALSDWLTADPDRLTKLFPPIPNPGISNKFIFSLASIVFFAALAFVCIFIYINKPAGTRNISDLVLSQNERIESIKTDGSFYLFVFSEKEALSLYDEALSLFTEHRDEKAKININKLLLSNASEGLKNKALLMTNYMEQPDFLNFKMRDNVSYNDVKNEPVLYNDVFVIWSGMAYNINDDFSLFDLHVGFDPRRNYYDGIVPVLLNEPVRIFTDRTLDILGKIKLNNSSLGFYIEGVQIRQSGRLE